MLHTLSVCTVVSISVLYCGITVTPNFLSIISYDSVSWVHGFFCPSGVGWDHMCHVLTWAAAEAGPCEGWPGFILPMWTLIVP